MKNDRDKQPIGVFDSGAGGLSVLKELVKLMPEEDFIFFGDSLNAPYGTKSHEEVTRLSFACAQELLNRGVKEIVIACNTATSVAAPALRSHYTQLPIIGIEPALKPAVLAHPGGRILVMATPLTLREDKFTHLMGDYHDQAEIIPLPCPELVEFAEKGILEGPEVDAYLREVFTEADAKSCDAAVLGCTHFPLLTGPIRKALGEKVKIYDGGPGTARQARNMLEKWGLLRAAEASEEKLSRRGKVTFLSSSAGREEYYRELFDRSSESSGR